MILMQQRLPLSVQLDGFGSDSVRLVRDLRRDAQQPVQFLLFSATLPPEIERLAAWVACRTKSSLALSLSPAFASSGFSES